MSSVLRYWIGFSLTIILAAGFGFFTKAFIDEPTISLLTSFIGGAIIGIVGFNLTRIWSSEAENTL